MVVLCVTNCPTQLRGDLTKWMIEVNTGVYVGRMTARVREAVWQRVCESIKSGQATMVFTMNNEQGYSFLTHNSTWVPTDYEGVTLIKKLVPLEHENHEMKTAISPGFSKAAHYQKMTGRKKKDTSFVILDIETTGLNPEKDRILEVGMIRVKDNVVADQYQCFVRSEGNIPSVIEKLTGITMQMISEDGLDEQQVAKEICAFIGRERVLGYNLQFDLSFLEQMEKRTGREINVLRTKDIYDVVKRKIKGLKDYKLRTVAQYYSLEVSEQHRALEDCILIKRIVDELNKN